MKNQWLVTVDDQEYHVKISRNALGLTRVWVNGKQVTKQWKLVLSKPVSVPLGKSIANFIGNQVNSYFKLTLDGKVLYPMYMGDAFTLPRSKSWFGKIMEILFFTSFIVLLSVIPFSSSTIGNIAFNLFLAFPALKRLTELFLIIAPPPSFDAHGLQFLGRNIRWSEVETVGLDSLGALMVQGEYSRIIIPPWLSTDTPALARWISEKTDQSVSSIIPVTLAWIWKWAPFIIGLIGFFVALGLFWAPWWAIASGLAIGITLGLEDLDNIIKGPLRGIYTLSGTTMFLLPIILRSSSYSWNMTMGIVFAVLSCVLGFVFAIRALPNFRAALDIHDVSL